MKKYFKLIIAIVVLLIFIRAILQLAGFSGAEDTITKDSIAVISIEGAIFSSKDTIESLKWAKETKEIKAIILKINSPGGAVTPSMEIYNYLLNLGKPTYAAISSLGASGGYLIGLGCDSIFSEPSSITGSIGVIMNLSNYEELLTKIGIKDVVLKSGKYKDAGNPARSMAEDERKVLEDVLMDMYRQFVEIVSVRRGLTKENVLKLADGRIYTGAMAKKLNLINELGSWEDAGAALKLHLNMPQLEYHHVEPKKTGWQAFLDYLGIAKVATKLFPAIASDSSFLYMPEAY